MRLFAVWINRCNSPVRPGSRIRATGRRPALQVALAALFDLGLDFGQKRFAVGDRQLIVIGVDFGKRQEPVAIATIVDKGRLQGWFNPCHTGQIDVGFYRAAVCRFVVDLFDATINHNHDPGFITAGRVDKHFLAHHIS